MPEITWVVVLTWLLVAFFVFGGVVNLIGPKQVMADFARWGYPSWFNLVTGVLELATGALLALPGTRAIGLVLGGCIMLAAAGTVLLHREYGHAVPALVAAALLVLVGWGTYAGTLAP